MFEVGVLLFMLGAIVFQHATIRRMNQMDERLRDMEEHDIIHCPSDD